MSTVWFIYTKDGIQYAFSDRLAVARDLVNGDIQYCYYHWLMRWLVQ